MYRLFNDAHADHIRRFNSVAGSILILFVVFVITSCRQLYDSVQGSQRARCMKLPAAQYDECMKNAMKKPYDEYERERKEALDE